MAVSGGAIAQVNPSSPSLPVTQFSRPDRENIVAPLTTSGGSHYITLHVKALSFGFSTSFVDGTDHVERLLRR